MMALAIFSFGPAIRSSAPAMVRVPGDARASSWRSRHQVLVDFIGSCFWYVHADLIPAAMAPSSFHPSTCDLPATGSGGRLVIAFTRLAFSLCMSTAQHPQQMRQLKRLKNGKVEFI
jgi:hypothetical protein